MMYNIYWKFEWNAIVLYYETVYCKYRRRKNVKIQNFPMGISLLRDKSYRLRRIKNSIALPSLLIRENKKGDRWYYIGVLIVYPTYEMKIQKSRAVIADNIFYSWDFYV